jgi:hypothetical protein
MQYKMDLHHAHGHSSWRLICSIDMDLQRRLEHAAWNEHVQCSVHLFMLDVFVHAACLSPCCILMSMLHVHPACPCPCYISMSIHVHASCSKYMLHVLVHAACSYPCCMHIPLLYAHVHAANPCPWWMSMFTSMMHVQVHAACMYMRHGHGLAVWTGECSMWPACRIDRGMQHVHTWTRSMTLMYIDNTLTYVDYYWTGAYSGRLYFPEVCRRLRKLAEVLAKVNRK